jgi:protocatechuate 3,4-dioxygenase beta subunit
MARKPITDQRFSRRDALRLAGAASAVALVGPKIAGKSCAAQEAPACVLSPALEEGPFFVDEKLNRSDIRIDPTDGTVTAGVPLVLKFTVQRVQNGACTPLTGAFVDVWHVDAPGLYSDETQLGTQGKKFLRGYQVTDANGAVQFTTIYPGWYGGRTVHIHFKARLFAGSQKTYEFTTQLFLSDALTDAVYAQAPYNTRGARDTRNSTDRVYNQAVNDGTGRKSGDLTQITLTQAENAADGYIGTLAVGVTLT